MKSSRRSTRCYLLFWTYCALRTIWNDCFKNINYEKSEPTRQKRLWNEYIIGEIFTYLYQLFWKYETKTGHRSLRCGALVSLHSPRSGSAGEIHYCYYYFKFPCGDYQKSILGRSVDRLSENIPWVLSKTDDARSRVFYVFVFVRFFCGNRRETRKSNYRSRAHVCVWKYVKRTWKKKQQKPIHFSRFYCPKIMCRWREYV